MNAIVQAQRHLLRRPGGVEPVSTGHSGAGSFRSPLYVLLSLVPSATLLCGWIRYQSAPVWSGVPTEGVIAMGVALWLAELMLAPLLVKFAYVVGGTPAPGAAHYRVEFLEAFAPPVLILTPLTLMVPALFIGAVVAAFVAAAMLLFIGRYGDRDTDRPGYSGMSWLVVELGFAGWAVTALLVALA